MADLTLPGAPWRNLASFKRLHETLGSHQGLTRVVGGAVRDAIAGIACDDVDLATRLTPDDVLARLNAARIKAVPTGLAHGTVTAVMADAHFEITTLRRDVETDGRRATVAYTDDWREDAARRDFTINALYADPDSGAVFDYFGGVDDLNAGLVRFIGDPKTRIAEDHLRILRFFRFHTRFGKGAPDAEALIACAERANDLMALSRERIADELLKLLALPKAADSVALMLAHGILKPVVPEIISVEGIAAITSNDAVLRLAGLLPADPAVADSVAKRLKLSKAITKRLVLAAGRTTGDAANPRALAYRLGSVAAHDRLALGQYVSALAQLDGWEIPVFPLSGGAIVARGISAGPEVARILKATEQQWIAEHFPDAARVEVIADAQSVRPLPQV